MTHFQINPTKIGILLCIGLVLVSGCQQTKKSLEDFERECCIKLKDKEGKNYRYCFEELNPDLIKEQKGNIGGWRATIKTDYEWEVDFTCIEGIEKFKVKLSDFEDCAKLLQEHPYVLDEIPKGGLNFSHA